MIYLRALLAGAALAAPVVVTAEWVGISHVTLQVFLLGAMTGSTVTTVIAVALLRRSRCRS